MRTSGRVGSEALMFVAPAIILGAIFLWNSGDTMGFLSSLDRWVLRGTQALLAAIASLW